MLSFNLLTVSGNPELKNPDIIASNILNSYF
jgi:hypothetical protein